MNESPARAGFCMPAEWTLQEAVWLSWPLNPETWPDRQDAAQAAYARFAAALARRGHVRINAAAPHHGAIHARLNAAGAEASRITLYDHPTNDAWCRDHGPTFLRNESTGEVAVLDWPYNAWGGKFPPWNLDDRIPERIAAVLGLRRFRAPILGEGGGIEVNGAGDLLVTESVWLNPNRNPGLSRAAAEQVFREMLGVERIHWLPGGLAGDDTDGHIDTLARFVREDTVVCVAPSGPDDPNRDVMERNQALLETFRVAGGKNLRVIELPQPGPIPPPSGWREEALPATYANFLIVNGAVLVPTYRQPERDEQALEIVRSVFP
ncbi:MAG: agmatine deiminase family protein, partial [Kiritimatiellia bacterium]|nr:agmatine deiminase family protein [Kiritimatiellia bacterium]